jgi:predicted dienelactone hydrolase
MSRANGSAATPGRSAPDRTMSVRVLGDMIERQWAGAALIAALVSLLFIAPAGAQTNRVDVVAPMAPELAAYGRYDVGVRTIEVTDHNRPDILHTKQGGELVRYDRRLTLEVWYPARLESQRSSSGEYRVITRDPSVTATLIGKAVRDADPAVTDGPFPLVIVSHGYPGNRFLMTHLTENLASKGFVVVSIDHRDSTYDDQQTFASTLYNRPFDQLFVLNEVARQSRSTPAPGSGSFLAGLVDDSRIGLVGYSMGGYGVINVVGGGYSAASESFPAAPPNRMLAERGAAAGGAGVDPRIKATIAIAPWGMQAGFWDAVGLRGIRTPVLFVAGSADEVAGYEKGTKALYQGAVNADRYLLTFLNANHNAAAPIPAPAETYAYSEALKSFPFVHYADAVWDTTRMNNILQHFATAYFEWHLKGDLSRRAYFEPSPDEKGTATWKGFKPRTAVGLTLEHAGSGQPGAAR